MKTFTIATEIGPRRWVRVRVHDTAAQLQDAAHRLRADTTSRAYWDGCYGCFHPVGYFQHAKTGAIRYGRNGFAGTLRLAMGHATSEIVAHELMHAAMQVYRMNACAEVRLGRQCGKREEQLAYIYGELFGDFDRQFTHRDGFLGFGAAAPGAETGTS